MQRRVGSSVGQFKRLNVQSRDQLRVYAVSSMFLADHLLAFAGFSARLQRGLRHGGILPLRDDVLPLNRRSAAMPVWMT